MRALRLASLEAMAFARQAVLLHRDFSAVYPASAAAGDDVVVLLHGLFATAGVLRPLRRSLEHAAGVHTASFTYMPGPGVERAAARLGELLARLPSGVRIHLVGHSMGGVILRWFMQELGGDARVVQTISLGSPFFGTRHARLMPSAFCREIVPGSSLLARLRGRAWRWAHVPHLSIAAERDSVVTESVLWPLGDRMMVRDCGHNGLLFHPEVARVVSERVVSLQQAQAQHAISR